MILPPTAIVPPTPEVAIEQPLDHETSPKDDIVKQVALAIPALLFVIYSVFEQYMTPLGVVVSLSFILVAHFPFQWIHWPPLRMTILCGFFFGYLYHLLPGYNHHLLERDLGVVAWGSSSLRVYVDLVLVIATFSLTFFRKDRRFKVIDVEQSSVQFIQMLTPKYRSKIIMNCWTMAITLFLGMFFFFNLGTIDLKLPNNEVISWFAISLLVTGMSHEFFMRGELQYFLTTKLGLLGVALSSMVSGLFFLPVSPVYAFMVLVTSLCSGYAYYKSQLIVAAVVINISISITHFFFLTYPFNFGS